jgi:hypothetical protein
VICRPEFERASRYFEAVLPWQFDAYIWFDKTSAVTPFDAAQLAGLPDTYPFGVCATPSVLSGSGAWPQR